MVERTSRISLIPGQAKHSFELGMVQMARKSVLSNEGGDESEPLEKAGKTSTFATGMNFVTTMVGAGVLGFPGVFSKAGWFYAPAILLAMAIVVMEVGVVMSRSLLMIEERAEAGVQYSFGKRVEKYEDMSDAAFGSLAKTVTSVSVNLFMLMICGVFTILIGMSFEVLTAMMLPFRLWVLIMAVLFIPLTLLDDMSFISRLSFIGVVASLGYVICVAQASLQTVMEREATPPSTVGPAKFRDLGSVLSVMLLGFSFQMVVPTIRAEMENPRELPTAVRGSVSVVLMVYFCVGACGYYAWGSNVAGNVTASMLTTDENGDEKAMFAGRLLSIMVIANLIVTFPIVMHCVVKTAEAEMMRGQYSAPLRIGCLVIGVGIGLFCPYFLPVLTFISSFAGVAIGIFIPLAVFWKLQLTPAVPSGSNANSTSAGLEANTEAPMAGEKTTDFAARASAGPSSEQGYPPLNVTAIFHVIIVILSTGAMVFGTIDAVNDIVGAMEKPGGNPIADFVCPMTPDPDKKWRCKADRCKVCPPCDLDGMEGCAGDKHATCTELPDAKTRTCACEEGFEGSKNLTGFAVPDFEEFKGCKKKGA